MAMMSSWRVSDIPVKFMILGAVLGFYLLIYLFRWLKQRIAIIRALSWPSAEAVVENTYDLDLSTQKTERWATALQYSFQVNGQYFAGTYFLPDALASAETSAQLGKDWLHRKIIIRYKPSNPLTSMFLEQDGAPGKPYIPVTLSEGPQFTTLSLK